MYKYDFICLSETYLDSSVLKRMLLIDGYNLVWVTIAMISKEVEFAFVLLPVRVINLSYFQEELLLEMTYYNKNVTVLVICRSRSQSNNEFDSFVFNLEKILSDINNPKPALPIITGNLMQDLSSGGLPIVILQRNPSCLHYLHEMFFSQLINKPAHMQTNSTSCTDLFFTDKLGLSAYSGIHSSLHPNCHHQIVYSTFNLNICYTHHIND